MQAKDKESLLDYIHSCKVTYKFLMLCVGRPLHFSMQVPPCLDNDLKVKKLSKEADSCLANYIFNQFRSK